MNKQRGSVSVLGLLGAVAGALVLLAAIRVAPVYYQHHQIMALVDEARVDRDMAEADRHQTYLWFKRAFRNNNIWDIEPKDVIHIKGAAAARKINVNYEITEPLFFNMSLLLKFDEPA